MNAKSTSAKAPSARALPKEIKKGIQKDMQETKSSLLSEKIRRVEPGLVAEILVQALPYIRQFYNQVMIVKYSGTTLMDPEIRKRISGDIALLHAAGIKPVIVHGGGRQIDQRLLEMGIESKTMNGRRITTPEVMEVVEEVLDEEVNEQLVEEINSYDLIAVGLSGSRSGVVEASMKDPAMGFVGKVDKIHTKKIKTLLAKDLVPVISCLGRDKKGQSYNINADILASALAIELKAERMLMLTNVPGLYHPDDKDFSHPHIPSLSLNELKVMLAQGGIQGGMIPKLEACAAALEAGTFRAHLLDSSEMDALLLELFTDQGIGTMITNTNLLNEKQAKE